LLRVVWRRAKNGQIKAELMPREGAFLPGTMLTD